MNRKERRAKQKKQQQPSPSILLTKDNVGLALEKAFGLHQAGNLEGAEELYKMILSVDPDNAEATHHMGMIEYIRGDKKKAEDLMRRSIDLNPDEARYYFNYGKLLLDIGRLGEAEGAFVDLVKRDQESFEGYRALGCVLALRKRDEYALKAFQRASELKPDDPVVHENVGIILAAKNEHDAALAEFNTALKLQPDRAETYNNIGMSLRNTGKYLDAMDSFKKALEINPDFEFAQRNILFTMDFDPDVTIEARRKEWDKWYEVHAKPFAGQIKPHTNDPNPNRKLRIGYVSADFRSHSAGFAFFGILSNHDSSAFDTICYSGVEIEDEMTMRFKASATKWHSTFQLSDEALAEIVREDEIDILVDLSGHTAGNRLTMFAMKPAPVQISAWGHAVGTGLPTIDYLFSDRHMILPGEEKYYVEDIYYLPSVVVYSPPSFLPNINDLPVKKNNFITFGSFNRLAKISDKSLELWAKILNKIPDSHLLLKSFELGVESNQIRIKKFFSELGVNHERITTIGKTPILEHLEAYHEVDIALDPFPHGGGVTTLEGLWMGVPTITLRGRALGSRATFGILSNMELNEYIAETEEEYISIAKALAKEPEKIASLRSKLRGRIKESILGDEKKYTNAVEEAYREIWRRWCAKNTTVS